MKIIDVINVTEADLIRMKEGKMDLPVGISRMSNGRNGYRLHRTLKGETYRFGTFQNLEQALRVNVYIGRLIDDFREVLDTHPLSKEDLEEQIERQTQIILEAQRPIEKKSFWQRVFKK